MTHNGTDNKDTSKAGLIKSIARWPWPEIVFFIICMYSTVTIVSTVAGDYSAVRRQAQANAVAVDDHDDRLRALETQLTRIDTNVEWIRATLESQSKP
jgi:hypothetical protein